MFDGVIRLCLIALEYGLFLGAYYIINWQRMSNGNAEQQMREHSPIINPLFGQNLIHELTSQSNHHNHPLEPPPYPFLPNPNLEFFPESFQHQNPNPNNDTTLNDDHINNIISYPLFFTQSMNPELDPPSKRNKIRHIDEMNRSVKQIMVQN